MFESRGTTQKRARNKAKAEVLVTLCFKTRTTQLTRLRTDLMLRWTVENYFWTLWAKNRDSADEVEAAEAHEAASEATEEASGVVTVEVVVMAKETEVDTEAEAVTAETEVVIEAATEDVARDEAEAAAAVEAAKAGTTETIRSWISPHCNVTLSPSFSHLFALSILLFSCIYTNTVLHNIIH